MDARPQYRTNTKRPTPAVVDAIEVLEYLRARSPAQFGAAHIAREVGISRSTCHAILQTLQSKDYVVQNPLDKTFALGPALVALGVAAAGETRFIEATRAA